MIITKAQTFSRIGWNGYEITNIKNSNDYDLEKERNEVRKNAYDGGKKCGIIVLTDLSNAYGSTDMPLIIKKLAKYFNKNELGLIRSFLVQPTGISIPSR